MASPHFDIVARLREIADNGQRSDQRVAAAILSDADFATHASIERLAQKAGVSEPTITRFCRTLGFGGTREFKVKLAQSLAIAGRFIIPAPVEDVTGNSVPSIIAKCAIDAIETVTKLINRDDLERAAEIVIGARMVRAYGSGGASSMAATELENRLFRLGIHASSHIDGEMQQMTAATSTQDTVIVAYSLSGEVKPLIEAVTIAGRYGAKTIALHRARFVAGVRRPARFTVPHRRRQKCLPSLTCTICSACLDRYAGDDYRRKNRCARR